MKLYGYENKYEDGFIKLDGVTIIAEPEFLRKIAEFIFDSADAIEKYGNDYDHEHLQDYLKKEGETWDKPDIIIGNS